MIELVKGNLLEAPVEALVNTVNTVGVMGKGIALQFKRAFPEAFKAYEKACKAEEVHLGKMHIVDLGGLLEGPRWIINFPTKGHWRAASRLSDIKDGLRDLADLIQRLNIRSIALPPLGCGHGGLDWGDVRPAIESALTALPKVKILLYAPGEAPMPAAMPNRTERPPMTVGRAALLSLMDRYIKGLLDPIITLLEIHKLMYFLQEAGEPLRLGFEPKTYGPYAINLRHVLSKLESHYTQGYGDGHDNPKKTLELLPGSIEEAHSFLIQHPDTQKRIDKVSALIDGFEDPYGMELLSSVHWVVQHAPETKNDPVAAVAAVRKWNPRKGRELKPEHLRTAWQRLKDQGWNVPSAVNLNQSNRPEVIG